MALHVSVPTRLNPRRISATKTHSKPTRQFVVGRSRFQVPALAFTNLLIGNRLLASVHCLLRSRCIPKLSTQSKLRMPADMQRCLGESVATSFSAARCLLTMEPTDSHALPVS